MKKRNDKNTSVVVKRYPLVFSVITSMVLILGTAVSTFAWFQAEAQVRIQTTSSSATVTVSAPDVVKFYYFKGNGTPGTAGYTGYSKYGASFGNTTNTINTTSHTYTIGSGNVGIGTFANAWGEIDISSTSLSTGVASRANCFNFNYLRPGCFYSFCVDVGLSTSSLTANFSWNGASDVTGASLNRLVYDNGRQSQGLNMLMAINAYCVTSSSNNAASYIEDTVNPETSMPDKINFSYSASGTSAAYSLLSSANTSTNHYIYFTLFMGKLNKGDALMYKETYSGNAYYELNNANGSYSPLEGLKSTLSSIVLS